MRTEFDPSRAGVTLICVLACLLVTMSLIASTIRTSIRSRRESKQSRTMLQTELLVEAAALRAFEQLAQSSDYIGETWQPNLRDAGFDRADVVITIERSATGPETPTDDPRRIARDSNTDRRFGRIKIVARIGDTAIDAQKTQRTLVFYF